MSTYLGNLVLVVGPSGAGKDTVLNGAREVLSGRRDYRFPLRDITRPANSGNEIHSPISESEFLRKQEHGAYFLSWQAHGLSYGVPINILRHMEQGCSVVVNISRTKIEEARALLPNVHVIMISASPDVLAERIAARGRETADEIARRLSRQVYMPISDDRIWTVLNDTTPECAIGEFVKTLENLRLSSVKIAVEMQHVKPLIAP